MNEFNEKNMAEHKPWKKAMCVLLSVIIAFGTLITLTVGSSRLQDWLGIKSMLSAYAAEIVDTTGAVAVDEESMLADNNVIDLENSDGSNTIYLFSEPISFTDENGNLKTKDISVEKQSDRELKKQGYTYTNGQNDYRINFSEDINQGLLIESGSCTYSIIPQTEYKSAQGKENVSEYLGDTFETFEYSGAFGAGTSLKFYPQLNGIKDEIVLNQNIDKTDFSFELKTENCTASLNDDGTVTLVNANGENVQTFSAPFAYDSEYVEGIYDEHYSGCTYTLEQTGTGTYILSVHVDAGWLDSSDTVYPVVIDPTTSHIGNMYDLPIHTKRTTTGATVDNNAVGTSTEMGTSRSLIKFQKPSEIKAYAKINSAYYWTRELTGRTSAFKCGVYKITSSWNEKSLWTTRPTYNGTMITSRNINSASKDYEPSPYWYKFNITSLVQQWYTGTTNYGFMMKYENESASAKNLRTFAQEEYSSSAWRPYTVINYTNDATAPTVTSVTGNATSWTSSNVTLTVNGAKDNSGGVGMHSTPYSFSTTKGSYSWQASKSKTFSSNCTVYIYVRDAYNNIRLVSTQTISKIDKSAPTYTNVMGNAASWTNSNVTLKVNGATDTASGLHSTAYSFTTTSGSYSWQSGNTKTVSSNGTYYIYIRDAAGNIRSAGSVNVSKIDKTSPVISDITVQKDSETKQTTVTITASDSLSGIAGYSFDGGTTWQTANSKALDSVPNTISVAVKDNAGNITTDISDTILPEFYEDGALIGIYNPNTDSSETMQYKIGEDGEWTDYSVPFAVPLYEQSTVYARVGNSESVITKTVTPDSSAIGAYTESNTDFTLSYRNVSFDFTRSYSSADKKWFFATDSHVEVVNGNLIKAVLPDSSELSFIRVNDTTYKNELGGYTLSVTDSGYIIQIEDINYSFDSDGRLSSVSSKYDDIITITRSASAITVADEENRAYILSLDANGNIVSVTDPADHVITYSYDESNNLTKVVDQAGVTLGQYSYTNGVLTKSLDKSITYLEDGRVSSFTYDSGAYLNYTYDDENKTVSTQSSAEVTTSETYNDALLTVSSTDEDGNTTEYTYDEYYRVLTETSDGATVTYTYDSDGNVLSEVSDDEDAENTYYVYDSNGNLIRQQTGNTYSYTVYNDNGEIVLTATLKENYSGEIPEIYNSDLTCFDTVSYTYDNGMITKTVDSKTNETVSYTYDKYGNTVKTTTLTEKDNESATGTVDCTYDIMGNLLTSVSGEETSSYIYDAAGRTLLANEKGDCTRTIYDNLGRIVQEIAPEDYDSSKDGLPEENTYSDAAAGHTYVYAANGTLTSETNRLGKTTKYFYNDIGSKAREEFDIYKFYYLNHGELYQVKVANVTTVSYSYDNDFNLLSENYANDDVIRYTYNDNGDITAQYHNSNANPYVTYTYNEDGDLTEKVNTDTGLKYVYDGDNVSVYKTSDNTLVQSYTQTETEADEQTGTEAYTTVTENHFGNTYTSVTKEKSVSYTSANQTIEYSYQTTGSDEDEKIASDTVKNGDSTVISSSYTYDDNGNITKKETAATRAGKAYDYSIVNEYDDEGRITATGYSYVTEYFTYDGDGQLTRVDNGTNADRYTAAYSYDSRGNVTSKKVYDYTRNETITSAPKETTTFTYANTGWKDQLVAVNDVELTYDANGNVLTYGDREYEWESGRNLKKITDGENTYSYTYDESGIRTSKTVNGVTTYYNTKDGVIQSQTDGTNTWYFQYDTNGTPLGFIYNGVQYFYLTNQMGDVVVLSDSDGNIFAEYVYDAWGSLVTINTADENNAEQLALANANPLRYRGYYYDNETGYYYLQSRYYDPSICRFINADTADIAQMTKDIPVGANLFAYCNNDPVNNDDPTGVYSGIIVYYYKPKSKAPSTSMFGHLDIRIDNTIYSYAKYSSGNLLITSNINKYHNHQKKKYTIQSRAIKVTKGQKNDILYFYKHQKHISTYKAKTSFDTSGKSKIYKINSGAYKTYKLTSKNCSTFVLDGLRQAFSLSIIIYRIIQRINYPFQELDTPAKIFELVRWLASSR